MNQPAQLLWLHARLQDALDGTPGVADADALMAAWSDIASAQHGDIFGRAATSACALSASRPFVAGNHAAAVVLAGVLLREFDLDLQLDVAAMPHLAELLRAGHVAPLADWLRAHTVPFP